MKIKIAIPFFAVFLLVLMGCTQDEVLKEDTSVGGIFGKQRYMGNFCRGKRKNIRYRHTRRSYHPHKP